MPYQFLDDVATADIAFRAWGKTREELFQAAADATMNVMLDDLASIAQVEKRKISLQDETLELLLFQFLQELIFYKDAEALLLRPQGIAIAEEQKIFNLEAELNGEKIKVGKHQFNVDVKAVTLHRFRVEQRDEGWQATVVLDI
jgi:SHS2 domain-containing protein